MFIKMSPNIMITNHPQECQWIYFFKLASGVNNIGQWAKPY